MNSEIKTTLTLEDGKRKLSVIEKALLLAGVCFDVFLIGTCFFDTLK